jgi:hypothetical protein
VSGRDGAQGCRRAGLDAELIEHMLEVLLNGAGANREQGLVAYSTNLMRTRAVPD